MKIPGQGEQGKIWKVREGFDNIEDAKKRMGFQTFWIERRLRTVQEL